MAPQQRQRRLAANHYDLGQGIGDQTRRRAHCSSGNSGDQTFLAGSMIAELTAALVKDGINKVAGAGECRIDDLDAAKRPTG